MSRAGLEPLWTVARDPRYARGEGHVTLDDPLFAQDFASALLGGIPDAPCLEGTFVCTLRSLVDYFLTLALALAVCIVLGFVLAISFSIVSARRERRGSFATAGRRRLVSGPIHTDGVWVRLVEDEHGRRLVEVLEGTSWTPATRESQPMLDMPVGTRPPG